ncbi:MAG: cation diffusion facilitator family transporter [Candidatus Aminicenantes bacterium]|nr:cation diffusion facilitator family transporter [Candidatus Aminicenantes bacterium]
MQHRSKKAVIAALFGNLGIAIFKMVAALFSGSSSMLAESYHSISDTLNQVLLLYGLKRSQREPDERHRFGYGKEQFFWSFMVAMILFGIAGTLSIREGYRKFLHPEPISHLGLTYMAIAVGLAFDGYAFSIAFRSLKCEMKSEECRNLIEAVKQSKDPTTLTVFIEDVIALSGLLIAAIAITLVHFTGILIIDAIASIIIGVLLMVFAVILAFETKKLLVGEAVTPLKRRRILKAVLSFKEVKKVICLNTMHLSSEEVLVTLEIKYQDDLIIEELEKVNDEIEKKIKDIIPGAKVYLEAEDK